MYYVAPLEFITTILKTPYIILEIVYAGDAVKLSARPPSRFTAKIAAKMASSTR